MINLRTRSFILLKYIIRLMLRTRSLELAGQLPRPAYCDCCGDWTWTTRETPVYTTGRARLCEPCAEVNDEEWAHAWRDYYGSRL